MPLEINILLSSYYKTELTRHFCIYMCWEIALPCYNSDDKRGTDGDSPTCVMQTDALHYDHKNTGKKQFVCRTFKQMQQAVT